MYKLHNIILKYTAITVVISSLLILFGACDSTINTLESSVYTPRYSISKLNVSDLYDEPISIGTLNNREITEASGITECRQNSNLLWTHNDSGDMARIFLINKNGEHEGTFRILNASNRDWEDIASGPGPENGVNYLYIGEIGDNAGIYQYKHIYRLPEPDINKADLNVPHVNSENAQRITFIYPDNKMIDAEALLVDPLTKDIYIITKREFPVTVYRLQYPQCTTDTLITEEYATLPINNVTGGDFSDDGRKIILRTYEKAFIWERKPNETIGTSFLREPQRVPLASEPKGEAITFAADGSGYYTLSEFERDIVPEIYFYKRNQQSTFR